jgi:hypothetical protein
MHLSQLSHNTICAVELKRFPPWLSIYQCQYQRALITLLWQCIFFKVSHNVRMRKLKWKENMRGLLTAHINICVDSKAPKALQWSRSFKSGLSTWHRGTRRRKIIRVWCVMILWRWRAVSQNACLIWLLSYSRVLKQYYCWTHKSQFHPQIILMKSNKNCSLFVTQLNCGNIPLRQLFGKPITLLCAALKLVNYFTRVSCVWNNDCSAYTCVRRVFSRPH